MLEIIKNILSLIFAAILVIWIIFIFFWPITILLFIVFGLGKLVIWFVLSSILFLILVAGGH